MAKYCTHSKLEPVLINSIKANARSAELASPLVDRGSDSPQASGLTVAYTVPAANNDALTC